MSITWRKQMSVGNMYIDDQHRYLLCLMNTIELALRDSQNKDILKTSIEQLIEYTKYHFEYEERLQTKIKLPKLMEHKMKHQKIIADINSIKSQLDNLMGNEEKFDEAVEDAAGKEISDSELNALLEDDLDSGNKELDLNQLTALVRHWVMDHILGEDLNMRPYLSKLPKNFN